MTVIHVKFKPPPRKCTVVLPMSVKRKQSSSVNGKETIFYVNGWAGFVYAISNKI